MTTVREFREKKRMQAAAANGDKVAAEWIEKQRRRSRACKAAKLQPAQIKKLESLPGWTW